MAHIVYDGKTYDLAAKDLEKTREAIRGFIKPGGSGVITLTGDDGDKSHLYVSPGVNIAVNEWDTPWA